MFTFGRQRSSTAGRSGQRRASRQPGWLASLLLGCALLLQPAGAAAHGNDLRHHVGFDQRLDQQVPLESQFRDAAGREVRLGDYLGQRPVILVLGYLQCPNVCSVVNESLVESLREVPYILGQDFDVVSISIDPRDTPAMAAQKKAEWLQQYDRPGGEQGWHVLTGEQSAIDSLAAAIGFRYTWDETNQQYAHPSGLTLLTPTGRISHYIYGISFPVTDLRLALVEASANQIGKPVDQLLLLCMQYDALTGRYNFVIMNIVRLFGILATVILGTYVALMLRRERRQQRLQPQGEPPSQA